MKYTISLLVIVSFIWNACQTKSDSHKREITGIYVREYSYKVIHPNSGQEIGMRTVRDSIFIEGEGDRYRITNTKWRQNDYDALGWQNMEHAEDRPMATELMNFDPNTKSLFSNSSLRIFLDPNDSGLTIGKFGEKYYKIIP